MDIKLEKSQKKDDDDELLWKELSIQKILKGYDDDDEPEYTEADIKEPNAVYQNHIVAV
jgi:hypothetical protein